MEDCSDMPGMPPLTTKLTYHSGVLKQKMQDANDRWDKLQQYVSTIMRRMKHSASLREDFNHTRV
jgi:hypothetical protein